MNTGQKNKEKRIDKEIFTLRNLPSEFKLGKKDTQLGVLIDVSKLIDLELLTFIYKYSLKLPNLLLKASCLINLWRDFTSTFFFVINILFNRQL